MKTSVLVSHVADDKEAFLMERPRGFEMKKKGLEKLTITSVFLVLNIN